jgi:glycosyltransferase involved in cell wall biosynthesis
MKVAIILSVIPGYRKGFFDILFERKDIEVTVYTQSNIPGSEFNMLQSSYSNHIKLVKFICAGEIISWQFLPFYTIFNEYDVVVIQGNPRQVSHFLLATFLRLFGKKVIIWTQAHSYRNFTLTENIRLLWLRIFKYLLVYTDVEVEYLRKKGFKTQYIIGMNNGLNQRKIDTIVREWNSERLKEWRKINELDDKVILLSCARLDPKNKFELIIHALPIIIAKYPNLMWCLIGNGVDEDNLRALVKIKGLSAHVCFVGAIYNESDLAPWFLLSKLFIHPASIGLSLLHAFGYGLPVVTHNNGRRHNPEYAAFEPELTGRNFNDNDIQGLSNTIINLLSDDDALKKMKGYTLNIAREKYNVDIMADRFVQIVKKATSTKEIDLLIINNCPSFYKINLYNELNKNCKIYVIFISLTSQVYNDADYKNKIKFSYTIIQEVQLEKRNKIKVLNNLLSIIGKRNYKFIMYGGYDLPELRFLILVTSKKYNCLQSESSIKESNVTGFIAIIKKILLSKISIVLPSGNLQAAVFNVLKYKGRYILTKGVGIFNKKDRVIHNYLGNSQFKYIYVGRLIESKNIYLLIKTFNENGRHLTIVGNGELENKLKKISKSNINFTGFIPNEDMGVYYKMHDVFILPSKSEPWGLVVEEAIYWGLPVIISNAVGCQEEIVIKPKTGIVFELNSTDGLQKAIEKIETNYNYYKTNVQLFDFDCRDKEQINSYMNILNQ